MHPWKGLKIDPEKTQPIVAVRVVDAFVVELIFADGSMGQVDLAPVIVGKGGVFAALNDPKVFAQVRVDPESGTIVFPNGVDLDPDVLYAKAHQAGE
jgi:uncharacterized protein DUF2442